MTFLHAPYGPDLAIFWLFSALNVANFNADIDIGEECGGGYEGASKE